MDQYYQHHYQWRQPPPPPAPPQRPNICPVCSVPHYPFCPPYPPYHLQNPNYHPQPPHYARPAFDTYQPPPPPTPPPPPPPPPPAVPNHPPPYVDGFSDPRFWHRSPSYGYDYGMAGGGEVDRSHKRPRVEEFGPSPGQMLPEDERRLQLIRAHGGASLGGINQENKYFQNNVNKNSNDTSMPPRSSEMYNIEDSINNCNDYSNHNHNYNPQHQLQHKDSVPPAMINWQGYEQRIGGYLPQPGGSNMAHLPPPPLPTSPPLPLPVEPPLQHHPSLFPISSSATAQSTYPVASEPYYQNKPPPHASGLFMGEVMAAFLI